MKKGFRKYITMLTAAFAIFMIANIAVSDSYSQNSPKTRKTATQKTHKKNATKKAVKKKTQAKKNNTAQKKQTGSKAINNLKNKQTQVKKEIKKIDDNLSKTKLTTRQTLKEIERLNVDIQKRNTLIAKQNGEIQDLEKHIFSLNEDILRLELNYKMTKQKYVDLIYHAYLRSNSQDRLMFIFSASSFQESFRRLSYIQEFASLRKKQAEEISTSKDVLIAKRKELERSKQETKKLLVERENEQNKLIAEKKKQNDLVISLKQKEKELKKELAEQQKKASDLEQEIQKKIAKEAEEARKRAQRQKKQQTAAKKTVQKNNSQQGAKQSNAKTQSNSSTDSNLTQRFRRNKGYIIMPIAGGTITGRFGNQPHPVLKHVTTNNKGVYVTGPKGSEAKCAYDGEVTQRFSIPGSNNAVIVRHGSYLTVYANLTNIYVKVGQKVIRGQKLGKVYEDSDNRNKATLFFQIWNEKELLNPEQWIKK